MSGATEDRHAVAKGREMSLLSYFMNFQTVINLDISQECRILGEYQ